MIKIFSEYLRNKGYNNFDLKAVIFDMDGVLYDSMPCHDKSWKIAIGELNLEYEPDEFYMQEGRLATSTINSIFRRNLQRDATEEEQKAIYDRKLDLFNKCYDEAIMPGAGELLDYLKQIGLTSVLVTGSAQPSLIDRLNNNFPGIFNSGTIVTAFDVERGKPNPEPFIKGLEKGGNLKPNQAIVIENAPLGIKSAVAAGIFTIALNTGLLSDDILKSAGAATLFDSMATLNNKMPEIIDAIQKITL